MTTISEISTHKAVRVGDEIQIILKGFKDPFPGGFDLSCPDELLYTIPARNEDDVFSIMEGFIATNGYLTADFKREMNHQ